MTDVARFLKKNLATQVWDQERYIKPKMRFFAIFFEFGSLFFLQIVYNDSFQQCLGLRSIGGKTYEKNFRNPNLGQKWT